MSDVYDVWGLGWRRPPRTAQMFDFGFGAQYDRRSTFSGADAWDAYMKHVRTCTGHHDPRGPRFSRCPNLDPSWFAPDSAETPT